MAFTVKQLAEFSGVSVRTLHHYDDIGLLKPAYYGDNQYRYYEEPQALMLQQILFYRKLGFQLNDIQKAISSPDFDQVKALESHRKTLEENRNHTQSLIETIDKTLSYLRGGKTVKLEEIFDGFNEEKQRHYEEFLIEKGVSEEVIQGSKNKVKHWSKTDWMLHKQEADEIHDELIDCINKKLPASSKEAQAIIKRHYQLTAKIWQPNHDSYIGLSECYGSHPDFVKFFNGLHPELLNYMSEAMRIYAENELN